MSIQRCRAWGTWVPLLALLGCGTDPVGGSDPSGGGPRPHSTPPTAPPLGPAVHLTIRSSDDLLPMPARVLFYPSDPKQKLDFRSDGSMMSNLAAGVYGVPEGVMLPYGKGLVPVPPGSYRLRVIQGMEYESVWVDVRVDKRQVVPVDVVLDHSVQLPEPGWLGSDQHIHSKISSDSRIPTIHRVVSEVCSGISVLVPTEHVFHYDLEPEIKELGLTKYAVSIPGSEYGFDLGHIGVFPVTYDPRGSLLGAPEWQRWPWGGIDAPTYFPLIHQLPGQPLVVINHPRLGPDLGYFHNLRWLPGQPLAAEGLFDGLEVINGYENTPFTITPVLRDWFYLLNRGRRVTGVGNSDTHRADWLRAGYPRTFLRLPTDQPDRVLPSDVRTAMLQMQAIATNGPLVHLKVDGHGMGETVAVVNGQVKVDLWADAAGWIDISRVIVYRNGEPVAEVPITYRAHPSLQTSIQVAVPSEGWIVAVVVGNEPLATDIIGAVNAGLALPIGFTNPVWLDLDGDGQARPPGNVPPMPEPFGHAVVNAVLADQELPRILETPLHAPLDCEPSEWPLWLR